MDSIFFAAAGDIHGSHALLIERLDTLTQRLGKPLAFVLQVGDFEPIRDASDLTTVAGPLERRLLGDFHRVFHQELSYPAEVLFIGGNHEPYGWLETFPEGGEIVPGIYYLGRAGIAERYGLRIAGLSGIHSKKRYELPVPPQWADKKTTLKEPTYFRQSQVEQLLASPPVDILLTHDWPRGHFGPFGNPQSRLLLDTLRPRLHLVGHMHFPAQKLVIHPDGSPTLLVALNLVGKGKGDVLLFEWDGRRIRDVTPS